MEKFTKLIKSLKAFSVIEVLVSIIIISAVTVAFAPVMNKHFQKQTIDVSQADKITADCSSLSEDCYSCFPSGNPNVCLDCEMDNDKRKEKCTEGQGINPGDCHCKDCDDHCLECTFNAKGDQKECKRCEDGYYLNYFGKCVACSEGHYCINNENNECEVGTHQDETAQSSCKPCDKGTYQDEKGKRDCKPCGSGKVSTETGSTECTNCSAGTYANPEHTDCPLCAAGTYQNQEGKDSCSPCNAGTFSSESGATLCTPCPTGTFSSESGATNCPDCGDSKCAKNEGSTTCSTCSSQVAHCAKCEKGNCACNECQPEYCESEGKCSKCAANYYKSGGSCVECPPGLVTGNCNEATSCSVPPCNSVDGCKTCPTAGVCTKCLCGWQLNASTKKCDRCPAGQYSAEGGTCQSCPKGSYCPAPGTCSPDSPSGSKPQTCDCGTYSAGGASVCTNCGAGKYSAAGASACTSCDKGKYCSSVKTCTPTNCACGTYSAGGASVCTNCGAGKYSAAGASACTSCTKGKYCSSVKTCTPSNCAKGKYSTGGASACTNCAANKYSSAVGSTVCANCASGKYSKAGASACLNCTAKGCKVCTAASNGATCTTCLASPWFKHDNGKCYKCRAGTSYYKAKDVCIMTKNIGDDQTNFPWPSGFTKGSQYGTTFSVNNSNSTKVFCWTGVVSGSPYTTVNSYSGQKRTVCTWYGANSFCAKYGGKITTKEVTESMLKSAAARYKFNICSNFAGVTNAARCGTEQANCKYYDAPNTTSNRCLASDYYYSDSDHWVISGCQWTSYYKNVQNSSAEYNENKAYVPRSARCQFSKTQ